MCLAHLQIQKMTVPEKTRNANDTVGPAIKAINMPDMSTPSRASRVVVNNEERVGEGCCGGGGGGDAVFGGGCNMIVGGESGGQKTEGSE